MTPACPQVMLKDIADSKRANVHIQALLGAQQGVQQGQPGAQQQGPQGAQAAQGRQPAGGAGEGGAEEVEEGECGGSSGSSAGLAGVVGLAHPSRLSATILSHLFWPKLGGWGDSEGDKVGEGRGKAAVLPEFVVLCGAGL